MPSLRSLACLFLGTLFCVFGSPQLTADDRPNIIFIFADDLCFDSIAELGNEEVETPNLDRLAREGTSFSHAYNMGSWSGAVCLASRTMLNSGRFVWQAKEIYQQSEREREEGRWWGEMLKAAGYRTYMTGKWHCRANAQKSFDVVRDVRPGMPKDFPEGYNRPIEGQPDPWSPSDPKWGGFWEGGTHWSEVVANHADDFFADAAEHDEPTFMYLAFNATHDPRQAPQEFLDKYPAEQILVPQNYQPLHPYAEEIGCGRSLRDERLAPFPRTEFAVRVHRREYYALLTHMDAMIGRILDAVDQSGEADNTWIFFTADHGLAVGQHGLLGKQNPYDHSVRVPFLVKGPGVQAGGRVKEPVYLQDVMPTTLELAQIEKPAHIDFHSVLPLMNGARSAYPTIYGAYLDLQRSIRTEQYKLIVFPKAKTVQLFDMLNDPLEQHDLAANPAMAAIVKDLFDQLQILQTSLGDELVLPAELIGS
ncbi:sulfatase-like hydrolase/transferase [Rhodopirellula halodulae]|uniref:sulfatase-like hydrolase/transferase n=1 Tax=Rhodopirellula halodulae TaxID=2894198 RepID=UPI001E2BCF62|nr:sulfatase-like hydrolase/transferase [Rhodopirellula sp. JC737]MCC9657735.1 sulfatase-like hydrolase/transferase [Rhodopirellula sp. JC737]